VRGVYLGQVLNNHRTQAVPHRTQLLRELTGTGVHQIMDGKEGYEPLPGGEAPLWETNPPVKAVEGLPQTPVEAPTFAWQDGLFSGCFSDIPICLFGWACNQALWASNMESAGQDALGHEDASTMCMVLCSADIIAYILDQFQAGTIVRMCIAKGMANKRTAMRAKYGLEGQHCCCEWMRCCGGEEGYQTMDDWFGCRTAEGFDDYCAMLWCRSCAVCQDARMLKHYGFVSGVPTRPYRPADQQMGPPPGQGMPVPKARN